MRSHKAFYQSPRLSFPAPYAAPSHMHAYCQDVVGSEAVDAEQRYSAGRISTITNAQLGNLDERERDPDADTENETVSESIVTKCRSDSRSSVKALFGDIPPPLLQLTSD